MSEHRPALRPEEWEEHGKLRAGGGPLWALNHGLSDHGIAAICLKDKPYGFTREEIAFLQRADGLLMSHYGESIAPTIEKISNLLPPSKE